MWYEILQEMYKDKQITMKGLRNAVLQGLISADQYKEIAGEIYTI